jgi:hypothetical protein
MPGEDPITTRRYRCRVCGRLLPAWLPVAQRPNTALLLGHLSQQHPDQVGPYLDRMRTEDIATVAAEAYEVIEDTKARHDILGHRQFW